MEIVRFYQAALVNALFGFGVYALLIRLGFNIYLAQLLAHCLGIAFNYVTYSRHVFRARESARFKFVLNYAFQYLIGLALLIVVERVVSSPYVIGAVIMVLGSVINYFVLKYVVFVRRVLS